DRFERNVRIEDCCMGLMQFRGGAQALVQCDLANTANVENYSVRGSEGLLQVEQRKLRLLRGAGSGWEVIDTGYDDPWVCQARGLVEWLEGAPTYRGEGRQARATLEILMAIYQSARAHEVVRMPLTVQENPLDEMFAEGKPAVTQPG